MISSVTDWIEAAMSISRCVNGDFGSARRAPEQLVELRPGHREALAVVEVAHVHAERAIVFQIEEMLENLVVKRGSP